MNNYNEQIAILNNKSKESIANKTNEFNLVYILKTQENELININITNTEDLKTIDLLKNKHNFTLIDIINNTKHFSKGLRTDVSINVEVLVFIKNNFKITQITKSFEIYNLLFTNYKTYINMPGKDIISDLAQNTNNKRNIIVNYLARLKYSYKNYRSASLNDLIIIWLNDYKKFVENNK